MRIFAIISFLFLTYQSLLAQNKFNYGVGINGGFAMYSYSIKMDGAYAPYIPNSKPIDSYFFGSYQFLKRFEISAGAGFGYENLKLDYKDFIRTDSLIKNDSSVDVLILQNQPIMYHDKLNLISLYAPLNLRFYVLRKLFFSVGITGKYYLNKRTYNAFEVNSDIGLGLQYTKWSLGMKITEPTRSNGIKMINNNQPNFEFQDYLIFSKRMILLSFNYRLSNAKSKTNNLIELEK